jgi:hypothetical protein
MSEEKLYAIKNDEGEWMSLDGTQTEIWYSNNPTLFKDKSYAEAQSMGRKAHVVELVEPEKVVLSKKQAEIVEKARVNDIPATYISSRTNNGEEKLLMNAYVNGYTVAKEKKYGVWVPHVKGKMYYKDGRGSDDLDIASADCLNDKNQQFTFTEIEHYGLQDCEKEEVTDDEQ